MIVTLNIAMICLLFWVFYEDLKDRSVTSMLLIVLGVLATFLNFYQSNIYVFFMSLLVNTFVVLIVTILLYVYARVKLKKQLFEVFGEGDLVFFLILALGFPLTTFLVLFACSLIFSFTISIVFQKKLKKWVPLAGLQAFFIAVTMLSSLFTDTVNLYAF